jgi:hypothetical protein
MDERLARHFSAVGVEDEPEVEFHQVYRYFNTQAAHAAAKPSDRLPLQ